MGKRGPKSKITEETLARIRTLYEQGSSLSAISKEIGCSEKHISRIIASHHVPKRKRKLTTSLTSTQEEHLTQYLLSVDTTTGNWTRLGPHWTYSTLKRALHEYAQENGIQCAFTYSWRTHFIKRHKELLELPVGKLFCLSQKRRRRKLAVKNTFRKSLPSARDRAVRQTKEMFEKAGLTDTQTYNLLKKLKVIANEVPGAPPSGTPSSPPRHAHKTVPPTGTTAPPNGAVSSLQPPRHAHKTAEQLRVLEELYREKRSVGRQRSEELAPQLGLMPKQIVRWFHHRRQMEDKALKKPPISFNRPNPDECEPSPIHRELN